MLTEPRALIRDLGDLDSDYPETLARLFPEERPVWQRQGPPFLALMGRGYPLNLCSGIAQLPPSPSLLAELEEPFRERGLPPALETDLRSQQWTELLRRSGYQQSRVLSLLVRDPHPTPPGGSGPEISVRAADNLVEWQAAEATAWEHGRSEQDLRFSEVAFSLPRSQHFIAFYGGSACGVGSLRSGSAAAWLVGGATSSAARRRGIQSALIAARLQAAAELGAEAVAVQAASGGDSERNLLRAGFRPVTSLGTFKKEI